MTVINVHLVLYIAMTLCVGQHSQIEAQHRYPTYGYQPDGYLYHLRNVRSDDITSTRDLPTTYKPPIFGSQDFWTTLADRRTFSDDFAYFDQQKQTNTFDFTKPLFSEASPRFKPLPPNAPSKPITEPYKYEYTYEFVPEPNFLPPPKPLRASIVKLEAVTGSPIFPPSFKNLSKEMTLHIDELGFHASDVIRGDASFIHQTTSSEEQFQTSLFGNKLHVLPAANGENTAIDDTTTEVVVETAAKAFGSRAEQNGTATTDTTTKEPQLVLTSILNVDAVNETRSNDTATDNEALVGQYAKMNSIKIVTDLTLLGLMKNKTQMANIPQYTKLLNMSSLIDYELNKLKRNEKFNDKLCKKDEDSLLEGGVSFAKPSTEDEDLSLDLKILKDTNWDGFTTPSIGNDSVIKNIASHNIDKAGDNVAMRRIEESENGTIIIETRVTKSVSKAKPRMSSSVRSQKLTRKMYNETQPDTSVSPSPSSEEEHGEKPKKLLQDKQSRGTYRSRRRKYRPRSATMEKSMSSISDALMTSRIDNIKTGPALNETAHGNSSTGVGSELSKVDQSTGSVTGATHVKKHRRTKSRSRQSKTRFQNRDMIEI